MSQAADTAERDSVFLMLNEYFYHLPRERRANVHFHSFLDHLKVTKATELVLIFSL